MSESPIHQKPKDPATAYLLIVAFGLLFLSAFSPLERNQEARVLETAREMLNGPARQWLVPRINGEIRVQKPPLAYWLSAVSMKAGGANLFAGRLPFVLVVLTTLVVMNRFGAREFSPATGRIAMGMILGTTLYASYGILAETDAISVLFVTLGIMGINQCADGTTIGERIFGSAMAGLFAGLAALSKGPPALFVPAYAVMLSIFEKNWRIIFVFVALGGASVMALIGGPWWLMIAKNPQYTAVLANEITRIRTGNNHGRPVWFALLFTASACLPYIGPAIGTMTGMPWSKPVRRCVLWMLVVLISLIATPQKQDHYYFQIVPPIMLIAAHYIALGLADETRKGKIHRIAVGSLAVTAILGVLASPAFIIAGIKTSRGMPLTDLAMGGECALLMGIAAVQFFRKNTSLAGAVFMMMGFSAVCMHSAIHLWAPTLRTGFADIARDMQSENLDANTAFYPEENYRINFELGEIIPKVDSAEKLEKLLRENPGMSVIIEKPDKEFEIPSFIDVRLSYPNRGKGVFVGVLKK